MSHALLAPSSMDRIIGCPASLAESDGMPNNGNKYAWEGTAAHTLASWCLEQSVPALSFIGTMIKVEEENAKGKLVEVAEFEVDEDMAGNVQIYLDKIYEYMLLAEDAELYVEQKVDFSRVVNYPDSTGTSDAIIVIPSMKLIIVVDLKYGRGVKVEACYLVERTDPGYCGFDEEPNAQAASYSLGVLEFLEMVYDIETVVMAISQPRLNHLSEFTMSVADLRRWTEIKMIPACGRALELLAWKQGGSDLNPAWYNPTEDNCKFCKGKTRCKAIRREVVQAIGIEFEDLDATIDELDDKPTPIALPDEDADLDMLYPKLDMIYDWVGAMLSRIESRMLAGAPFTNAKLVQGRKGNTRWKDEKQAEADLKAMRLKQEEIYNMKLISPTQAKDKFKDNPKRLKKLLNNTSQSDGKVHVAPASDPRDAWVPEAIEFEDLDAEGAEDLA